MALQSKFRKEFRRFKKLDFYTDSTDKFWLLPFNFTRLNSGKELLINLLGEFLIAPQGTTELILTKNKSSFKNNHTLYCDLLSNNFIHESKQIKNIEILANRYRTKKSNTLNFASLHIFVITLRCEHTCQYCQVSRVSQNKLKYDFENQNLKKAIKLMLSSPEKNITMEFQGGEALLAFDKIKFAISYVQKKNKLIGKNISFVICTNLAPINEEILQFCKKENILISSSLDGPKEIHNQNRKKKDRNSYELANKGIQLTKEILGDDRISSLMTTTKLSLKHPIKIIDEYRKQGFNSIFLRPISPYGFAKFNKNSDYLTDDFLKFYRKGLDYIINLNLKGEFFREIYTSIILKKIFTSFSENYVDLMSPTGLINSVIVYDYNGDVFVSDEARMLAQMNDFKFKIGTVDNSWKEILENDLISDISNSGVNDFVAGCDSCAYNIYCGSDPVHNYATQGDMYGFRPTSSFCKRNMGVLDIIFNKIDKEPETIKIFNSWIKNG